MKLLNSPSMKTCAAKRAFGCIALCHNLIFGAPTCSVPCLVKVCVILLQMFVLPMLLAQLLLLLATTGSALPHSLFHTALRDTETSI